MRMVKEKDLLVEVSLQLYSYRVAKGLTQTQVAELIGVTPGIVSRWERRVCLPGLVNLVNLAAVFGCSPMALLGRQCPDPFTE